VIEIIFVADSPITLRRRPNLTFAAMQRNLLNPCFANEPDILPQWHNSAFGREAYVADMTSH
jgi:hypothetical protein